MKAIEVVAAIICDESLLRTCFDRIFREEGGAS